MPAVTHNAQKTRKEVAEAIVPVASDNGSWISPVSVTVPSPGFWLYLNDQEILASGAPESSIRLNPGAQKIAQSLLTHWYVVKRGVS